MLLKSNYCRYLDYESHRQTICEKMKHIQVCILILYEIDFLRLRWNATPKLNFGWGSFSHEYTIQIVMFNLSTTMANYNETSV